jgi:hypothetical protein
MYKLTNFPIKLPGQLDLILRTTDNLFIPSDPQNSQYREYLAWIAEGNTPEPADPLPTPPVLTPEQKLAKSGLTVDELKTLLGLST